MKEGRYKCEDFLLNESFQRYVLHKSPEDVRYWETWISDNPDALKAIESAKESLNFMVTRKVKPSHKEARDQVYERLHKQIQLEKGSDLQPPVIQITRKLYRYAAAILLIAGCAFALTMIKRKPALPQTAQKYIEVIVPDGQRSQLLLPDGTKVWLNSGSKFKCPTEFLRNERNVYLEGEAFFNVKHSDNVPFKVHLKEDLCIKVLGTEFNVKSYPGDKSIETTLIKGSVKLIHEGKSLTRKTEVELKPNEKAVFLKGDKSISITQLVPAEPAPKETKTQQILTKGQHQNALEPITAWKEEELVFDNEAFEEIAVRMSRWYGFKITIADDTLKHERFTGKFANKENIFQVLDIFNRSEPIQYCTKNEEIIIKRKKKP